MHPILFEIPGTGFPIRSFGVMFAAAFVVAVQLGALLARRHGDDPKEDPTRLQQAAVWVLVGVVAGARLFYVAVEIFKYLRSERVGSPGWSYIHEPSTILFVWEGGLVMYGGFLGAVLLGLWGVKRVGLRPLATLDYGLVAGFCGLAVGRIGCLLVGDDHGSRVPDGWDHLPFPITLRVPDPLPRESLFDPSLTGEVVWATQPWMAANALAIAAFGLFVLRRRRYAGQVALWITFLYAITRFAIEHFRGDAVRGVWAGGLSTSQILSAVVVLPAAYLLFRFRARRGAAAAA